MSKKAKPTPADPKKTLQVVGDQADHAKLLAQTVLRPSVRAAITIQQWSKGLGENDLTELVAELSRQAEAASDGKMGRSEAMLVAQAHTLDAIFHELTRRAGLNMGEYLDAAEKYMRLALKAQSQCRTTWETLAEIKNPRAVAFVKQANIANNQQINNSSQQRARELTDTYAQARAGAREIKNQPNELLEARHGNRLDTGTAGQTVGGNQAMETVGAVNRAKDGSR